MTTSPDPEPQPDPDTEPDEDWARDPGVVPDDDA